MVDKNSQTDQAMVQATADDCAVPQHPQQRKLLREIVRDYAASATLVPPLQEVEVLCHSDRIIKMHPDYSAYRSLIAVMVSNEAWSRAVGSIPFEKRILFLPQCFRDPKTCPAQIDELGVLCEQCGCCDIGNIMGRAEALGYQVIVSEGTTAVNLILASGQAQCVVGVGCMDSLKKSFPLVVRDGIPSLAVPLLSGGCANSQVDDAWLDDTLALRNDQTWAGQISIDDIRRTVEGWFTDDCLTELLGGDGDPTTAIARNWLAAGGKRWRPILMASLYRALSDADINTDPVRSLAMSLECFHKASLIHDDIEDHDTQRYGADTLHVTHGVPVALNVGDLLIGAGYQLISDSDIPAETKARILAIASRGHRELCQGQGAELIARSGGGILTPEETVDVFRYKTAPAFEVALSMAASLAGADEDVFDVLNLYSKEIGIAYQMNDDLADFNSDGNNDIVSLRPSLLLAMSAQEAPKETRELVEGIRSGCSDAVDNLRALIRRRGLPETVRTQIDQRRAWALDALRDISDSAAKALLHRLANRILETTN